MNDTKTDKSQAFLAKKGIHQNWESVYLNPDMNAFYDLAYDRIVQALGATPGTSILDAGCGYGFHAIRLARKGLRVTGVDFSQAALDSARPNVEDAGVGDLVTLQQGDLRKLPFPDNSFDYVQCWGVLMHIPEVEPALLELARVLRPGGRLSLMENNMQSLHVRFWEPTVRMVKRALGRGIGAREQTPRGIEEWSESEGGGLMVRKTNMDWLIAFYQDAGLKLIERFPSQFTELYAQLPGRPFRRLVYDFNRKWLKNRRGFASALGNILVFEKSIGSDHPAK